MRNCLFITAMSFLAALPVLSLAQEVDPIEKTYLLISKAYPVPDGGQKHFVDINFKLGLNKKPPFKIGIQFENHGYNSPKIKFAIKDVTAKKLVLLDPVHNNRFSTTTLVPIAKTNIWSGQVDNNKDKFSLRVWDENGDEFDSDPISVSEY